MAAAEAEATAGTATARMARCSFACEPSSTTSSTGADAGFTFGGGNVAAVSGGIAVAGATVATAVGVA